MGYFRFVDKPHSTVNNMLYVLELFSENKTTQYTICDALFIGIGNLCKNL